MSYSRYGRRAHAATACIALVASMLLAPVHARAADAPPAAAPPPVAPAPVADPGPPPPLEDYAIPDIVVVAPTLSERPLFETTAPVNAITEQQMARELPRYFSDVVRSEPGLWNTQGSAGQMGTPVVRGAMGNQVLLLLDGVRVSNTLFAVGPGTDWDLIDMEWVERIEVVRSPDAVLYGTQGVGGATALYSAFPSDYTACGTCFTSRSRLLLATGGENLWRVAEQASAATPRTRAVVSGSWTDADDADGGGDVGKMVPTRFSTAGGSARFETRVSDCDTLGFSFFVMEKSWPDRWLNPSRDYDNWADREIGLVRWHRTRPSSFADDLELRVGLVHTSRLYYRHDVFNRDQQETWTPQADLILRKQVGCDHQLTYGLHAHEDVISASVTTASAGKISSIPDGYLLTGGVYVQDEWTVSDRLRITAGLRFDLSRSATDPEAETTDPLLDPDYLDVDRTDSAWTGKLGVFYQASDCVGLAANLARGYRFPGPNDLASFRQSPDEIQVGNPDLKPEYSTVLDLAVHLRKPCWRASIGGFVAWFDDLIVGQSGTWNGLTWLDRDGDNVQDPDEDFFLRTNAGTATFSGIEASAEWEFRPCWTLFGNFTYWHGDISPDPTEPIGIPTNGTVGVRYGDSATNRFWGEAACHMVARFDDIPAGFYNDEAFFFKDPQNSSSGPYRDDHAMPGYTLVDIRGGWNVNDHLSFTASVENVFDREYRAFGSRRWGAGTTFVFSAQLDF